MQTDSSVLDGSNNNNNNSDSVKNLQAANASGGQFVYKPLAFSSTPSSSATSSSAAPVVVTSSRVALPPPLRSMSPGLGGGGTTVTAAVTHVTMSKTLGQSGGVAITTSTPGATMLPTGVQIVNMRPGAPQLQHATTTVQPQQGAPQQQQPQANQPQMQTQQQQQQPGQRTVATVQPRIIGSQNIVTTNNNRTTANAVIPQGQTLLVKTESGQFQLLRVATAPGNATGGAAGGVQHTTLTTNPTSIVTTGAGGNQTIRLQTMPASTPTSNIVLTSNAVAATGGGIQTVTNAHPVASVPPVIPTIVAPSSSGNAATTTMVVTPAATPSPGQPAVVTTSTTATTTQQNTKEKCRKFLANLLDLSSKEPKAVEKNVRTLIQELIDNAVEPEGFCNRLERLLNASPQPCLIGFLKKSLPVLRQSMVRKEITIEGINPPPYNVAYPNATAVTAARPNTGQTIIPRAGAPLVTASPRPTTITRHTAPGVRLTGPRPPGTMATLRPVTTIPALQPVQIRATGPPGTVATIRPAVAGGVTKVVKVGQTQIKQVTGPGLTPSGNQVVVSRSPAITTITQRPGTVASGVTIVNASAAAGSAMSAAAAAAAQKERKNSFYQHNSISSSSIYGDDEINDVAAMGGVNLAEESQRILGSTEMIGTQIRSCKDEVFLNLPALQSKIRAIVAKHGLEEAGTDVAVLVSHAAQERLKNIVEKLAVIAEHRVDVIKLDPRYEVTKDVRGQIKFLEELDKAEQKRHDEQEREMLLRAAKSRTKNEDPEQAKLKAKAKEMQRAEMEELRQRDANLTALQAIGSRKKPRLDGDAASTGGVGGIGASGSGAGFTTAPLRPRMKRVNLRDMIFYLEQERETCRSAMLYRAYLK